MLSDTSRDHVELPSRTEPITVVVNGEVVAKGRPRMTRQGFVYTPARTRKYEAYLKLAASEAMMGRAPLPGPVRLELFVELPISTSWSQKKKAAALAGAVLPISRPDLDNYQKVASDAINLVVIVDDSQIVETRARKRYGPQPKLLVMIFPLETGC